MTEIIIVTTPSFDGHGKRRHGRFDVRLKDSDEIICDATQQPMLDAARIMLRRGVDPSTIICKVRSDAPMVVTMRAPIGVAAQYDVMGEKFVRRKPDAGPMPSSRIENGGSAEPRVTRKPKANARAPHEASRQTATPASPTSPRPPPSPTSSPASPTSSSPPPPSPAASPASRYRRN